MKKLLSLLAVLVLAAANANAVTVTVASADVVKELGPGPIAPTPFLRVDVPPGNIGVASINYTLETHDGTNWNAQHGTSKFVCAANADGTTAGPKPNVGPQNEAGIGVTPAVLLVSISFHITASAGGCDFKVANHVWVGSPTVNRFTYNVTTYGAGTWTAQ